MTDTTRLILRWAPRVVAIAFTLFISLFALDAFAHSRGFWERLVALVVHLVPSFVLLAMVILAWRWEWIGAVVSATLAALFLWWNFTLLHNVPSAVFAIAGPLVVMAALYMFNWLKRDEVRSCGV